ncbi:MAG: response regulator [Rhodoferax sp.]|uniref:response regulator n=1 Tax=Rhodoferax sp. TaxID=50421 RepID=UPI0030186288
MPLTASSKKKSAPVARNELKVLLVDDDSFQLEMISEVLKSLGITDITLASSGAQALQTMAGRPQPFHLLVMDLHMPGMDGFQFMESVAKTGYQGALIIVSGQSADVMRAASLVAELRRFTLLGSVPKPVGRSALSALISKLA